MALDTNLVRYYRLGDLNDSVGSNNLTQNGTVNHSDGAVNNSGTLGASFTGATNYLSGPNYDIGGNNFSFSLWLETDQINEALTERCAFIMTSVDGQNYCQVSQDTTDQIRILWGNTPTFVTQTTTIAANTWYHIVGVADGTNVLFYFNGSQIDTDASGEPTGTSTFHIGTHSITADVFRYFKGHVGEVGIWTRALSGAEVTELYNGGAGITYPFPVAVSGKTLGMTTNTKFFGG